MVTVMDALMLPLDLSFLDSRQSLRLMVIQNVTIQALVIMNQTPRQFKKPLLQSELVILEKNSKQ